MTSTDSLTFRRAGTADATALRRLAALDSARALDGDVLVAELDGRLVAALSPADGRSVADPFVATASVVALLRLRAAGASPRRRWAAWRGHGSAVVARLSPT